MTQPWGANTLPRPATHLVLGHPSEAGPPNIFMQGDPIAIPYSGAADHSDSTYAVYAHTGTGLELVESGPAAADPLVLTEDYPPGGYTVHLSSADPAPWWGEDQAMTYFVVWRASDHLHDNAGLHYTFENDFGSNPELHGAAGDLGLRLTIDNAAQPGASGSSPLTLATVLSQAATMEEWGVTDPARPRVPIVAFRGYVNGVLLETRGATGGTWTIGLGGPTATLPWNADAGAIRTAVRALALVGGAHAFTFGFDSNMATGSVKLWFDNLTAGNVDATDVVVNGAGLTGPAPAVTADTEADGIAECVTALMAQGLVTRFEPTNEPQGIVEGLSSAAQLTFLQGKFYAQVKAADPAALVLGPALVTIAQGATFLDAMFDAGLAAVVDELSFHIYNTIDGDLVLGRYNMELFAAMLDSHGWTGPLWMSEWGHFGWNGGVYMPYLQARWTMLSLLLCEQYGIPKERFFVFYLMANGFANYPSFVAAGAGMLHPSPLTNLWRIYTDELRGTTHAERLAFGADEDFTLGSRFDSDDASVLVLMSAGRTDQLVTLAVAGTASLTVVGPHGATTAVGVVGGQASIPLVNCLPVYVRLPSGVTATVMEPDYGPDLAIDAEPFSSGPGVNADRINDGVLRSGYDGLGDDPYRDDTVAASRPVTVTTIPTRTASVTTAAGQVNITFAPGALTDDDTHSAISAAGIPGGTSVSAMVDLGTARMSAPAIASATVAATLLNPQMVTFAPGAITEADAGSEISGGTLAAGAKVRGLLSTGKAQLTGDAVPTVSESITATLVDPLPCQIGLEWGSPQSLERAELLCPPPWQIASTPRTFFLRCSLADGDPVTLASVDELTATMEWLSDNDAGGGAIKAVSGYGDAAVWAWDFAPVEADKLWVDIEATTFGEDPDALAFRAGGIGAGGAAQRPVIRAFRAFGIAGDPPLVVKYLVKA